MNKIGVWKGDLIIENVKLRSDILDNFDFPLLL